MPKPIVVAGFSPHYPGLIFLLIGGLFSLPGCLPPLPQHAYYVSPLNGNNTGYQPLPLQRDSAHSTFYAAGSFFTGSANEQGTDYFNGGRVALSAAHHYGMMQFFYGLDGTLGSYTLGTWRAGYVPAGILLPGLPTAPPARSDLLNGYSGPKTFGSAGFHTGINGVIPVRGGEWRFLGVETSLSREFGDYLSLRRKLPDSLTSLTIRSPFFGTFGLSTELIGHTRHGEFGFRFFGGWVLGSDYRHLDVYDNIDARYLHYGYSGLSFHYTYDRYTGYMQLSDGEKAISFQVGLHYRLNRPRLPSKERPGEGRSPWRPIHVW